jgi:hypothetical protein
MFADYERLVLEYYHQKKMNNKLPISLTLPTPAKLKGECEKVFNERFHKKDEQVIRDFFGKSDDQKVYLKAIQQCKPDRFKPLIKYLNNGTGKTDEKNIQLLAWLIDFPARPFDLSKDYTSLKEIEAGVGVTEPVIGTIVDTPLLNEKQLAVCVEVQKDIDGSNERNTFEGKNETEVVVRENMSNIKLLNSKRKLSKVVIAGVLLAATGAGGYWWRDTTRSTDIIPGNGGCMYWSDDHYQQIPCSRKMANTLVVALDTVRLKNFKKITRPDTITHRSKGCVWYSKIDTKLEFFTADGEHPVVIGRRLKPISDYIINKYIHPGVALDK